MNTRPAAAILAVLAGCGPGATTAAPEPVAPGEAPAPAAAAAPRGTVRLGTVVLLRKAAAVAAIEEEEDDGEELDDRLIFGPTTNAGPRTLRPHVVQAPVVTLGSGTVTGGLSPDVIKRVIRQRMAQLTYCYQRQHPATPPVTGTLSTRFTIEPSGAVTSATVTGLHPAVASCIQKVLSSMRFPQPQGGGKVVVSYPFLFRPGSGTPPARPPPPPPPPPGPPDRVAERIEPAPGPPRLRCEPADPPDAVRALLPALTDCYQAALQRSPGLAGVLLATVRRADGATAPVVSVDGLDDPPLHTCVGQRLAGIAPPADADLAFTLGLDTDSLPEGVTEITLGAETLHVGAMLRRRFMRDWHRPAGKSAEFVGKIAAELARPAHVLLRGDDDAPALGMARTTERLRQAGVPVVVARRDQGRWSPVAALPTGKPWATVCPDGLDPESERVAALTVMVADEGIWVASEESPPVLVPVRRGDQDTIAYARLLRDRKRGELRGRADAEIAAERGVPWRDLARAVDILHDTGFFELLLVAVPDFDPRQD